MTERNPADVQDIVGRLQMAATDAIHEDNVSAIYDAIERITELEAANFVLAAGSCDVKGGKIGDERGNFYCTLEAALQEQSR